MNKFCVQFLIFCFSICIKQTIATTYTSPFEYTVNSPANMYRSTYSSTLTGTNKAFTVTYPAAPFQVIPKVIYSVTSLVFSNGIFFNFSLTSTALSSLSASIDFDSTLTKVSFAFLVMDSSLYSLSFSSFSYVMPAVVSTPQSVEIINHSKHDASFMVGIKISLGTMPAGYAPEADSIVIVDNANIITTNLTLIYDPYQVYINQFYMYFVNFTIASFVAPPNLPYAQQFVIYGTNGVSTDQLQTNSYLSMYPTNFLTGLQMIYDIQFMFTSLGVDAINFINNNAYYFTSELLIVSYHCPKGFPATDSTRTFCFSQCEIGSYADSQMICQLCNINCYTCIGTARNCTSCAFPHILTYGFVCGCDSNSYEIDYPNGTIACQICSLHINGCQSCTSAINCIKCQNNLLLTTPLVCTCPLNTILVMIGGSYYCVNNILSRNQNCSNGFISIGNSCICPQSRNLSLISGQCV